MMCYRDLTFCPFWDTCKLGDVCGRALTQHIKDEAAKWWGEEAPIAEFKEKPVCYEQFLIRDENGDFRGGNE
jgi:hypothetical protein